MGRRRLLAEQVIDIRKRLANRESLRSVAALYELSIGAIQKIGKGATYADIGGPLLGKLPRKILRAQHSDKNPNASLTYESASLLRKRSNLGESTALLAEEYGISRKAAQNVVAGKSWLHSPVWLRSCDRSFPDKALLDIDFHRQSQRPTKDSKEEHALIDRVLLAYRSFGYPHRELRLRALVGLTERIQNKSSPIANDFLDAASTTGLFEINAFHPYMDHVRRRERLSSADVFQDDALFREAIKIQIRYGRRLTPSGVRSALSETSSSSQISNFRPVAACSLYKHFQAKNILDFCSGWGGRMVGALAASANSYTGIDPNHRTIASNNDFLQELDLANNTSHQAVIRFINEPAEDVFARGLLEGEVYDLVFTSPPYFNLEEYAYDQRQSFIRYRSYDEWLNRFLRASLIGAVALLSPSGIVALNVPISMEKDTSRVLREIDGIEYVSTLRVEFMQRRFSKASGQQLRYEPVLVFRKITK